MIDGPEVGQRGFGASIHPRSFGEHCDRTSTWAASPQTAIPGTPDANGFNNKTVRNIVFTSVSGNLVRVRFTNTFGDQPLQIRAASIAMAGTGAATTGRSVPLTFGGQPSVQIPIGAEALSDPVHLHVPALQDLAVSVYLPTATGSATLHSLGRQTNYVASGDHSGDTGGSAYTTLDQSWYFIDAVDVPAQPQVRGTLVAFGDSITDGFNSTVNANARWPNDLARRLDSRRDTLAVADEGISGDRVLTSDLCCGVNALARLDRDVLERAGAKEVILLMGINDIGFSVTPPPVTNPLPDVSAAQIIAGYQQIIAQAHAAGLKIFGGTLTPFKGAAYYTGGRGGEARGRQPLDPDQRCVRRGDRLRQRRGRSERSDDDGAAVRQWRPPAPQRRGLPGDGQRDPAEAAPQRGAITRRDRITPAGSRRATTLPAGRPRGEES